MNANTQIGGGEGAACARRRNSLLAKGIEFPRSCFLRREKNSRRNVKRKNMSVRVRVADGWTREGRSFPFVGDVLSSGVETFSAGERVFGICEPRLGKLEDGSPLVLEMAPSMPVKAPPHATIPECVEKAQALSIVARVLPFISLRSSVLVLGNETSIGEGCLQAARRLNAMSTMFATVDQGYSNTGDVDLVIDLDTCLDFLGFHSHRFDVVVDDTRSENHGLQYWKHLLAIRAIRPGGVFVRAEGPATASPAGRAWRTVARNLAGVTGKVRYAEFSPAGTGVLQSMLDAGILPFPPPPTPDVILEDAALERVDMPEENTPEENTPEENMPEENGWTVLSSLRDFVYGKPAKVHVSTPPALSPE